MYLFDKLFATRLSFRDATWPDYDGYTFGPKKQPVVLYHGNILRLMCLCPYFYGKKVYFPLKLT